MIVPAPTLPHGRQERAHAVVGAVEICGEDGVPVLDRERLEAPFRDIDAGGIDEHVDAAKALEHGLPHRRYR